MRLSSDLMPSIDDVISTQCVLPAEIVMAVRMGAALSSKVLRDDLNPSYWDLFSPLRFI
jgi:hypothetical protein